MVAQVLTDIGPISDGVFLEFAIDDFTQAADQNAVMVLGQQRVPIAAPDDLEDIPASAAKHRLELLDNLAIATHRAVQALQIAVNDKDQVVQTLARRQTDGPEGLWFIGLAI